VKRDPIEVAVICIEITFTVGGIALMASAVIGLAAHLLG
jgi:hypothetical protein